MFLTWVRWAILAAAVLPLISYAFVTFAAWRFFRRLRATPQDFTPPISVLKPVCGLDHEAYENFASFCRQDYPQYEVLVSMRMAQPSASMTSIDSVLLSSHGRAAKA